MFMVCGEALMDVFVERQTPTGLALDARIGGSPLNVAIGLARLGRKVDFIGALSRGFMGDRLALALQQEGVGLSHVVRVDAPTTLGLVGLDAQGSASYAFYGQGCADRLLQAADLPVLGPDVEAMHFGSYSMVVEPVAGAHRELIERERGARVIAYDPNVRLNVEPDLARWSATVEWMVRRVHLLKISSEDLSLLKPGVPPIEAAADWLTAGVSLVVVTRGGDGALACTAAGTVEVSAPPVAVADTVGAGDTFQAALLCWLSEMGLLSPAGLAGLKAPQVRQALEFAASAAAITCSRRGADMPRREEMLGTQVPG
ncbi:MAG TPA: carbohydrate kinase [Rubrivivax sp.]|nr:carbohydrate kinase [Rubrivivax sp.]